MISSQFKDNYGILRYHMHTDKNYSTETKKVKYTKKLRSHIKKDEPKTPVNAGRLWEIPGEIK